MALIEGSLSKWTNVMKGWQYRWFVLDDNAGLLSYYTSKEKMMRGVRRGCVRLRGAVIGIDDEDDSTFTITVDGKTFHFQARDAEEREKWIRCLEDTILRHASRMRWDPTKPAPTIEDFDKKLCEADAYLQILIDQLKGLEDKMDKMTVPEDKEHCQLIFDHGNDMLESIKHTIVLLQIAKNTLRPVNGIYQAPPDSSPLPVHRQSLKNLPGSSGYEVVSFTPNAQALAPTDVQQGIEVGSECLERQRRTSSSQASLHRASLAGLTSVANAGHRASMTLIVPETSYSSSEEEDFFDANEYYNDTPSSPNSPSGGRTFPDPVQPQGSVDTSPLVAKELDGTPHLPPVCEDGSLDYDALYEDESEQDLVGSMENHGSVVSHLLSQVKIGMDLTKVVLPTFILERRSLLEMYADYFAHPDLFVSIADFTDPRDRMVQVVKWYMSAYHAGRKSAVAKKPYNPILGEVFQCHWNVPRAEGDDNDSLVTDGPIPWCSRSQLTFVAEQVSHHPPISAFYAEHYNKRISFCAHVWTKSKFLGLSIGVHNIGQGCVSVLDYDEEYIVTFPNGYGRSILTVPWIELGGSVVISCAKTGYSANVEFLTKPFYGGKKHRITAEVFQPNNKKPFLSIQGEWNGAMEAKWVDGRTEMFVDVNELHITKKIVRPIRDQDENESRRLWKEVTAGLRLNNIEQATNAKFELEQKQREEARLRKETAIPWQTKLFQEAGENWVYKTPLVLRLQNKSQVDNPH